ncbi:MFS transporter, partial [Solirubrobacter sp. CPCC 204708]|nr:MFS transporter [Solirubrobacter deserti]
VAGNTIVGFASTYAMLLLGRVLLGLELGGFWSMAAAVTMRLVPSALIPRALSIVFAGVSVAMAVSAPLGTYLGSLIGWRGVFLAAAALSALIMAWQLMTLPKMEPRRQSQLTTLLRLLGRRQFIAGLFAMMLAFGGHFAFFYLHAAVSRSLGRHDGG